MVRGEMSGRRTEARRRRTATTWGHKGGERETIYDVLCEPDRRLLRAWRAEITELVAWGRWVLRLTPNIVLMLLVDGDGARRNLWRS